MQRAVAYDLDILQRLAVTETTLAGIYCSPLLLKPAHILSAASRLRRTLQACNVFMQCNALSRQSWGAASS